MTSDVERVRDVARHTFGLDEVRTALLFDQAGYRVLTARFAEEGDLLRPPGTASPSGDDRAPNRG